MFYNKKKLIDEKVLQQYFFEQFMLADNDTRKKLLPKKYRDRFSNVKSFKVLHPEVNVGLTKKGSSHITDFVLYPTKKRHSKLNIEIKWDGNEFVEQDERFEFYDGKKGQGYVVEIWNNSENYTDGERNVIDNKGNDTGIRIIPIPIEDFKNWFNKRAYDIVSQALSNELGIAPNRSTGIKYWVIFIAKKSLNHYKNHGSKNGIWAFKDTNRSSEIMRILPNDYVIFVNLSTGPKNARMVFPDFRNKNYTPGNNSNIKSKDISWHFNFIDIYKIKKGYGLNFTDVSPFNVFDEIWMKNKIRKPEDKEYTQFIRFNYDKKDKSQYKWTKNPNFKIERKYFKDSNEGLVEFCTATRDSLCDQGDAREISKESFDQLTQLLSNF